MLRTINADLIANGRRRGLVSAAASLVLCPGFLVVSLFRVSSWLYQKGGFGRALGKLAWRFNILISGCYLSPKATIGAGMNLPHPVAIVIGDGARIGDAATLFQGVTVGVGGAKASSYPEIAAGVVVYASAIIAGDVRIGERVVIGAHSFVNCDIPDDATAYGVPARVVRLKSDEL